jgi:hypothetical protein
MIFENVAMSFMPFFAMGIFYTIPEKYARGGWSCASRGARPVKKRETEKPRTLLVS